MNSTRRFATILSTLGVLGISALTPGALAQSVPAHSHNHAHDASHTEAQPESDAKKGKGNLVFASTTEETGTIYDNETPKLQFRFKNMGSGPATIESIKPACGCTAVELEKKTYAPGESGVIEVVFDPKGKQGAIARNIQVYTDQENKPNLLLVVRSFVKPLLVIEPYQVAFSPIEKGSSSTRDIHIKGRFEDFEVTRVTTNDPGVFGIELINNGKVVEGEDTLYDWIIRVTISENAKPESYRTELSVRTNDESKPIFTVPVVARVLGDLQMTPIRMTLGRLVVGDTFTNEIHVRTKTGKAFEIKSASSNTIAIDAEYTFEPVDPEVRNDWIVRAKGKVVNVAPRFNAQLYITTDIEDEDMVSVQMYGQLRRN